MWHVGIDLHRKNLVVAAIDDGGEVIDPVRIDCQDTEAILRVVRSLGAFRAVIEATGTYRWLYDLLSPHGTILLAHPLRLRAMVQRRAKTDKLDAVLLAQLLRIDQIPLAYVPPQKYQELRDLTRHRTRLARGQAEAKIKLRGLLAQRNCVAPYKQPFGPRGPAWFRR
jgi:transposase